MTVAKLVRPASRLTSGPTVSRGAERCRRKFLRFFPRGFHDETYIDWERGYKWAAHERWRAVLPSGTFKARLEAGDHAGIAADAVRIESRTNLLFSFEKMALRDALKTRHGARTFATGLYSWLYGSADLEDRFTAWCRAIESLPRRQTRVLTWPLVTVFGFVAEPEAHIFLKPNVTRKAAAKYGFLFEYRSRPAWPTYASLLAFAGQIRADVRDLRPRDMIDLQSFMWVQGSDEY